MHALRGEAGMIDDVENRKTKVSGFATIGRVERCMDNALRLYNDALKTSPPTQAALLEIGIEELSKAMILFQNIPKDFPERQNFLKAIDDKNLLDLKSLGNIPGEDILAFFRKFEIDSKGLTNHRAKLHTIQSIFNDITKFHPLLEKSLQSNPALIPPYVKSEDTNKILCGILLKINDMTIEKWDQIKERGFYVYPEEGYAPSDEQFNNKDLRMIFFIMYSALQTLLRYSQGAKFKDWSYDVILDGVFDLLTPEEVKEIKKMAEASSLKDRPRVEKTQDSDKEVNKIG